MVIKHLIFSACCAQKMKMTSMCWVWQWVMDEDVVFLFFKPQAVKPLSKPFAVNHFCVSVISTRTDSKLQFFYAIGAGVVMAEKMAAELMRNWQTRERKRWIWLDKMSAPHFSEMDSVWGRYYIAGSHFMCHILAIQLLSRHQTI